MRGGVLLALVVATSFVAAGACTQYHRLGGRYDDGAGGEAGAVDGVAMGGTSSPGVAGGGSGAESASGGSAGGHQTGGSGGAPPASAGSAGRGGTAGEPENVLP